MRPALRLLPIALCLVAAAPRPTPTPAPRRIAIRTSADVTGPSVERLAASARRLGLEVSLASEGETVPAGWDLLRLSTVPPSESVRQAALVFPVSFPAKGFDFDGQVYDGEDEAVRLTTSTGGEVLVLGNSGPAVVALASRWLTEASPADYEVLSGELDRRGRFVRQDGRLVVDRGSDRDGIAPREAFFAGLKRQTRGGIVWETPADGAPAGFERWEKAAARYFRKGKLTVRVFPDALTKALYTGSARAADLVAAGGVPRVDLDGSAAAEPDLVTPVLAAAGLAASDPALLARPTLLAAAGARRAGRWWGREVKTFAAFTRATGAEPSAVEILSSTEGAGALLLVGSAASWLDAGARLESEAAMEKALGQPDAALLARLVRWRDVALRQSINPPPRRELGDKFRRGAEYASAPAIEDSFLSERSRETLRRLAEAGFDSIAVAPSGFARDARSTEVTRVWRGARGETDEGLLNAIADARAAGMTAMVSPKMLVGGGATAADIAMPTDVAWRDWFAAYRRFLVHEAVVAEAAGADLFSIGAGLSGTEGRRNDWKEVIAAVRLATGAALTYASSSASRAPDFPYWEGLDAFGADLTDPLARAEKVSEAALVEGARRAARPLAELSQRNGGKPVLLTAAGYPPVRGAWLFPLEDGGRRPAAPEDAARAIAAVYRALSADDGWRGVYWARARSDGRPGPGEPDVFGAAEGKAIADGFRGLKASAP